MHVGCCNLFPIAKIQLKAKQNKIKPISSKERFSSQLLRVVKTSNIWRKIWKLSPIHRIVCDFFPSNFMFGLDENLYVKYLLIFVNKLVIFVFFFFWRTLLSEIRGLIMVSRILSIFEWLKCQQILIKPESFNDIQIMETVSLH